MAKRKRNMNWQERITVDPKILGGKPTLRGTRISVFQILEALAHDVPWDDLLQDYPELERDDILASIAYAANIVGQERVYPLEV
jgi:uncharacterized protein (DUF433 family)